jgi:HSP20 family protein
MAEQQKQPGQMTEQQRAGGGRELERSQTGEMPVRRQHAMRWGPWGGGPFSMMRRMMEDFERVLEEPFGGMMREPLARVPAIDVLERGNQLVVRADVPGYGKDDIKLEITNEGLILEGERKEEREERDGGFYRRERTYGSFRRLVPLPEGIDLETVNAEMKNGVLEVAFTIPEQRTEKKRIEIRESSGETQTPQKGSMH